MRVAKTAPATSMSSVCSMSSGDVDWREVLPPEPITDSAHEALRKADALRELWESKLATSSAEEIRLSRESSLRRHAIETGIIERLYDVDWGVTHALVADGLTMEVASREGSLSEDALDTIRVQFEALQFLTEYANDQLDLTVLFVRQLHQALTRNQPSYDTRDSLGRPFQATLHHGEWKRTPNHVLRSDGSTYYYVPPERVQDQMESLVSLYRDLSTEHPLIVASWLHHRFISIHPFEDGNGRVARALTLLVMLRRHYAPLVVDRDSRAAYIDALDEANTGDLSRLVELFANLEIVALRSELEGPIAAIESGPGVRDVAKAYTDRIRQRREHLDEDRRTRVFQLAESINRRSEELLQTLGAELVEELRRVDPAARFSVTSARPGETGSRFWYRQIVRSAREVGFFANLADGAWWTRLHLRVQELLLRYAVVVQRVGRGDTGVLAMTVFAETITESGSGTESEELAAPVPAIRLTAKDSITLLYSDNIDDRWTEISEAIDRTLSAAIVTFASGLS